MSINFIGSLPESLTQGLLVGKLLVGGLGVYVPKSPSAGHLQPLPLRQRTRAARARKSANPKP